MSGKSDYEKKQEDAYRIAEADGFRQHPDIYWHQAQVKPVKKAAKKTAKPKTKTTSKAKDKLTLIEGIGPKISDVLGSHGIKTFAQLADSKVAALTKILKEAGPRFSMHKPGSWPKQAKLARDGKMEALKKLQDKLSGGK